jgi:hydrophobic/amphiphilic exporter-1 (mainly G- bacteria), HAE1 family
MGLTRLAIRRPLTILMFIVALILLGGVAYSRLRQDRFPTISFPAVFVRIQYPGASPTDVEELVTKPVEDALSGLSGLDTITSTSSEGSASINIRFVDDADVNQASLDVERRLAAVRGSLPSDIGEPSVIKADSDAAPVMNLAVSSGQRSLADIYQLANDTILPRLQSVDGVADVEIQGGLQREIEVKVDPDRLDAYGLSYQTIEDTLSHENVNLPGGNIKEGQHAEDVRAVGQLQTVDDLRNLIVETASVGVVKLGDVATVVDGYKDQTRLQRFNGQDAVGLTITKQSDANGVQVANDIQAALSDLRQQLPTDLQLQVTSDTAVFTHKSIDAVQTDLLLAVVLTGLVLMLFLHTWRNTLIVLLAIPTCLITTCLVIYFAGFSLNVVTLLALALSIGILVDDSIVVLENVNRHLERGEAPAVAALKGRSEIGMAAITITLVDVVVFLPVSFMAGNIGRLFREFGITIAATTLLSLFVSFTLTPMLASRWLRPNHGQGWQARFGAWWETRYQRLAGRYRRLLALGLRRRFTVLAIAFASLAGAIMLVQTNLIGSEYAPTEDDGLFQVTLTMPAGTSLDGTNAAARQAETVLRGIPEVQDIFSSVGGGGFGSSSATQATIAVQLVDQHQRQRSVSQVIDSFRRAARAIPNAQVRASVQNPLAGGGGAPIDIRILGPDEQTLEALASKVQAAIGQVPNAADVQNSAAQRNPEIQTHLDRARLADLRLSAGVAAQALRTSFDGTVVTQLRPPGEDPIDIRVLASDNARADAADVGALPLLGQDGTVVRLDQVATIDHDAGPAQVRRINRQGVVEVTANVAGRSLGDVARDVRSAMAKQPFPPGYSWQVVGQVQQQETAFSTLLMTLSLSVVLIYMLMVALYESWLTPFAIMFSLPVALVGAFGGLFLTGNTFNIFSLIATIMLMGLVGKNAILLTDFTNTLRAQGMERTEALLTAGQVRLRPILMTTSTVVFAMLPLALKLEPGNETRTPIAVVLIGGVLSSTLLTLVLVPGVYTILDDARLLLGRLRGKRPAPGPAVVTTVRANHPAISLVAAPPNGHYIRLPRRAEREAKASGAQVG